MLNLTQTPLIFANVDAVQFDWPGDFAILSYPHIGEPCYKVHHDVEPVRFLAYADALDYIAMLATGGVLCAEKASPAPSYAYRPIW